MAIILVIEREDVFQAGIYAMEIRTVPMGTMKYEPRAKVGLRAHGVSLFYMESLKT